MKLSLAFFIIILLFLSGCSSDTSKVAMNGESIYSKSCAACHGDKLQGIVGPKLVNIKSKYSEADIESIITKGTKNMPAINLNDEQSKIVAKWLLKK